MTFFRSIEVDIFKWLDGDVFGLDDDRKVFTDLFEYLPKKNATIEQGHTVAAARNANRNWELTGQKADDINVTYGGGVCGAQLQTTDAVNDQMIIQPHLDEKTAIASHIFTTNDEPLWRCSIVTDTDVTNMIMWTGLKKTNTPEMTDTDQIYFIYCTSSSSPWGDLASYTNWNIVYSINGVKYITDTQVKVESNMLYILKLRIDDERRVSCTIRKKGKSASGVVIDANHTHIELNVPSPGTTAPKSAPLKSGEEVTPFVGVQTLVAVKKTMHLTDVRLGRNKILAYV